MDEKLSGLEALHAIYAVKARYCRCVDTKDWMGLRELFAEDATFVSRGLPVNGQYPRIERIGVAQIVAGIHNLPPGISSAHHVHSPEVSVSGSRASAIWAMSDNISCPGDKGFHGAGHYHDEYIKLGDRWVFWSVELTRLHMIPFPGSFPSRLGALSSD